MKRLIIAGLLLTSMSAFAFMGHGMSGHGKMGMMALELNLSDAQTTQIRDIRKETRDEKFKLMDKMEELRDKTQTRILAVLNDEQKEKFIELRKEKMEKKMGQKGMKSCGNGKMRY